MMFYFTSHDGESFFSCISHTQLVFSPSYNRSLISKFLILVPVNSLQNSAVVPAKEVAVVEPSVKLVDPSVNVKPQLKNNTFVN